jgi:hypothetical protein
MRLVCAIHNFSNPLFHILFLLLANIRDDSLKVLEKVFNFKPKVLNGLKLKLQTRFGKNSALHLHLLWL